MDEEFNKYAIRQFDEVDTLLFGRKTYELMAGFWPTEWARKADPIVAGKMNSFPKIVFSKTLGKNLPAGRQAYWKNIRLIKKNIAQEIRKLKQRPGKNLAIFGSSNLGVSLIQMGLLDELRIMVNPVVIGGGTRLFDGLKTKLNLKLIKTKIFKSGNVLLYYLPIK